MTDLDKLFAKRDKIKNRKTHTVTAAAVLADADDNAAPLPDAPRPEVCMCGIRRLALMPLGRLEGL